MGRIENEQLPLTAAQQTELDRRLATLEADRNEDQMHSKLEKLQLDLVSYREAVDQILSLGLITPRHWQQCFLDILICTSQLYLDYLLVTKSLPDLEAAASESEDSDLVSTDVTREMRLRAELKHKLTSSSPWLGFTPENPFSNLTGLSKLQDYVNSLTLHLPEIYEETIRVEACVKSFLASHDSSALAQLSIGLQHLGRNHASFVIQTLEWIANEDSWEESLAVPKTS